MGTLPAWYRARLEALSSWHKGFVAANAAITAALKDKSVIDSLALVGLVAHGTTAQEMAADQKAEYERWGPLVKQIGFTAES